MKPMTLFESGDSNGKISLTEILNGNRDIDGIKTDLTYEEIAYVLCRRTANKKSMIDPSLAVAALGCSYKELMLDIRTYGLLSENLVNRDLSVCVNSIIKQKKKY